MLSKVPWCALICAGIVCKNELSSKSFLKQNCLWNRSRERSRTFHDTVLHPSRIWEISRVHFPVPPPQKKRPPLKCPSSGVWPNGHQSAAWFHNDALWRWGGGGEVQEKLLEPLPPAQNWKGSFYIKSKMKEWNHHQNYFRIFKHCFRQTD